MGISTLVPTIRVCITDNCTKLKIYDTTQAISTANTGGYGTANINATAVDSATISYTTSLSSTPVVLNVTATVNAQTTVSTEFLLAEITLTPADGEYTFLYSVVDGVTTKTYNTSIFNLCSVRCCVDKLWVKASKGLSGDSDCGYTGDSMTYAKKAMMSEATYTAIINGISCADTTTRDKLLKKLQTICKLENCNC